VYFSLIALELCFGSLQWYQILDIDNLCMRPAIYHYYTKSNTQREMVAARKSENSHTKETSSRAVHKEYHQ